MNPEGILKAYDGEREVLLRAEVTGCTVGSCLEKSRSRL